MCFHCCGWKRPNTSWHRRKLNLRLNSTHSLTYAVSVYTRGTTYIMGVPVSRGIKMGDFRFFLAAVAMNAFLLARSMLDRHSWCPLSLDVIVIR